MAENDTHIRTLEDRKNIIRLFYLCNMSVSQTIRRYKLDYPNNPPPARSTVYRIESCFNDTFSVQHRDKQGKERRKRVRTEDNIELVRMATEEIPTSVRKMSRMTGLKKSSVHNILRSDLNFKPYRLRLVQELQDKDYLERVLACETFLERGMDRMVSRILFSDEANFFTDGYVNRHNCIIWDESRPEDHFTTNSLSAQKVCVWGALSSTTLIGPYFFDGTINAEKYTTMLREYALPAIREAVGPRVMERIYFMQDGASSHYSLQARELLTAEFGQRTIGRGLAVHWPARSPDLTVADYFLWGYLKDIVYRSGRCENLEDLKVRITEAFEEVRQHRMSVVASATRSWGSRIRTCVSLKGLQLDANDIREE